MYIVKQYNFHFRFYFLSPHAAAHPWCIRLLRHPRKEMEGYILGYVGHTMAHFKLSFIEINFNVNDFFYVLENRIVASLIIPT